MNLNSIRSIILPLILITLLTQCKPQGDFKIPLDPVKANRHVIPIEDADRLLAGFQQARKELKRQIPGQYLDSAFNLPDAEMFNRDAIAALLNAKGATNLRIYLGRDEKGQVRFVLLPADDKGNDVRTVLVPGERAASIPGMSSAYAAAGKAQALESGQRCPSLCTTSLATK
jgi:hypothetical protein